MKLKTEKTFTSAIFPSVITDTAGLVASHMVVRALCATVRADGQKNRSSVTITQRVGKKQKRININNLAYSRVPEEGQHDPSIIPAT